MGVRRNAKYTWMREVGYIPMSGQIVFASGTLSVSPSPKNRMEESRSLIRNSARSSLRLFCTWMIRFLNNMIGSKGGGHLWLSFPPLSATLVAQF